nr:uncharacterized protein LOC123746197 [Procambarus clarkii]
MWSIQVLLTVMVVWRPPLSYSLQYSENTRADRFLSLFTVVRFKNSECKSLGSDVGICYSYPECRRGGGHGSGHCAEGYGSCCITTLGCSSSTSNNCTYVESPGYPSTFNDAATCTHTITFAANVCQVRMDVVEVDLAPPTTQGNCIDDGLTFSQDIKWEKVCGTTTDTHFYLDVDSSVSTSLTLTFNTGTASYPRKWKVRLCQLCCDQISLAPSGCGQYFTVPAGTIKGWNYGGIYLSGQNYAICVRRELNKCSAPFTIPLQGPNYMYLVTKDASNDHSIATNIYYSFTQNSC